MTVSDGNLLLHTSGRHGKVSLEAAVHPTWFERLSNQSAYKYPFLTWRIGKQLDFQLWWFDHVTKRLPWYKEPSHD